VRIPRKQSLSQRLCDACLSAKNLKFAAAIQQVKVDGTFCQTEDHADFPTGFASGNPFQALQFSPGQTWLCHKKRPPVNANVNV